VPRQEDEYQLEDLASKHAISAGQFIPFAIHRLRGVAAQSEAELAVYLRDIGDKGEKQRVLRVKWNASTVAEQPLGVSEHTVTEWAALGVASMVVSVYAALDIQAVTAQGDRFDYWVSDGRKDFGLEVSGTLTTDVEGRHASKVRQWRENPYGVDGFVITAGFATRQVILSFHRFREKRS
jgi:hypothetical protein